MKSMIQFCYPKDLNDFNKHNVNVVYVLKNKINTKISFYSDKNIIILKNFKKWITTQKER